MGPQTPTAARNPRQVWEAFLGDRETMRIYRISDREIQSLYTFFTVSGGASDTQGLLRMLMLLRRGWHS